MANGFFDDDEVRIIRGDEPPVKRLQKPKEYTCNQCGLNKTCIHPRIPVWGQGKKKVLLILDNPSENEDQKNRPWTGEYGREVKKVIEADTGYDLEKDFWTVFAVCCRGKVNALSVSACRQRLHKIITELNPKAIVPFGYWAMQGVSGDLFNNKSAGKSSKDWAGHVIPDQRWLKWIVPTWESFWLNLLDRRPDPVYRAQLTSAVKKAVEIRNEPIEKRDDTSRVKIITDVDRAINILERLNKKTLLAFDYETTGRKPYRKGHEIYSVTISDGETSWAFPFFKNKEYMTAFKILLTNKNIKWIAHNAKFEWVWTKVILGYYPSRLAADTMLGVHVLNCQWRVGLKSSVYCFYGVAGYDDEVEDYLSSTKAEEEMFGANGFNRIKQAPLEKVLLYNGLDSLYTFWLHRDLMNIWLTKKLKIGYNLLSQSSIELAKSEVNGLVMDVEGVKIKEKELEIELNRLLKIIQRKAEYVGWPKGKPFRPSAAADISKLLFDIKGYKPLNYTATGISTDKQTLETLDDPIAERILEWKKIQKLKDTYMGGVSREATAGLLHPFFNLHNAITYRSSSSEPNFQNFPQRDPFVSKSILSLLYPYPGQKFVDYDYKSIEVCVSACYNKDPNLIKYITDPSTDMHRDTGEELFIRKRGELSKAERSVAKNAFVFPEFYGSYFEMVAKNLWLKAPRETLEHLSKKGIRHLEDFTEHVEQIEKDFWGRRFPVYAQWKKDIYNSYLRKGYIESYSGFRYYGPLKKNEACNYQVQGSAFHCLLRTFSKLSERVSRERLKTKLMGQIHDALIPSIEPSEEDYIDWVVWDEGTRKIREDWEWIIVPLNIEKEAAEVDEPWSELKAKGLLGQDIKLKDFSKIK